MMPGRRPMAWMDVQVLTHHGLSSSCRRRDATFSAQGERRRDGAYAAFEHLSSVHGHTLDESCLLDETAAAGVNPTAQPGYGVEDVMCGRTAVTTSRALSRAITASASR